MSDYLRKAIEELEGKLQQQLNEATETKKAINLLCRQLGSPERYGDVKTEAARGIMAIKADAFFRKPLATAVREYLQMKGGAASIDEIYEALEKGGFEFVGKDDFTKKRGLQISLAKNRNMFAYLKATNTFGLWDKYGGRRSKDRKDDNAASQNDEGEEENESVPPRKEVKQLPAPK
jgi:hypothetical protein